MSFFDTAKEMAANAAAAALEAGHKHFVTRVAALLEGTDVQAIHFKCGHVTVSPKGFKEVAKALRSGKVKIKIDAATLGSTIATYSSGDNLFTFRSYNVLDTIEGRGGVVHEAAHAVADWVSKKTAIRTEESASFVAEAWYYIAQGIASENANGPHGAPFAQSPSQPFFDIATDLITRSKTETKPVAMTADQLKSARKTTKKVYSYKNGHYSNDGF